MPTQTRRRFLTTVSLAGASGFLRAPPAFAGEGPLETTTLRIANRHSLCNAPQHVAEELLRAEGFTEIRYIDTAPAATSGAIAGGKIDFSMAHASYFVPAIDAGEPIILLAGIHVGCFELFAREGIHGVADLKGKSVGVYGLGDSTHVFLAATAAHVGLDPANDIRWVTDPKVKPMELFADGKLDAFLGAPPEPQELRARKIGHVIFSSSVDRPWSQYFCCMLGGNREFIQKHPVATKRVLRAILKAADLCAAEPAGIAQQMVERGFTDRYDYALQALSEVPYDRWREYDAEDTVRFYALRLHEIGMIKSSPQKIIAGGIRVRPAAPVNGRAARNRRRVCIIGNGTTGE
jgi:NitT/TauT family transport system substrate-binding protein